MLAVVEEGSRFLGPSAGRRRIRCPGGFARRITPEHAPVADAWQNKRPRPSFRKCGSQCCSLVSHPFADGGQPLAEVEPGERPIEQRSVQRQSSWRFHDQRNETKGRLRGMRGKDRDPSTVTNRCAI